MKILKIQNYKKSDIISQAVEVLKNGGILIYPTETAYGVGVDATNQRAVNRVLDYKSRQAGKPLSVAVCDQKMAKQYIQVNQTTQSIYKNFLPGPITVISRGKQKVAKGVESEQGTLGIRIPDYGLMLEIIKKFGRPITATSANLSGEKTPYSIDDILENISDKRRAMVDLILDAGQLPKRPTSTVVDATMEDYQVVRRGAVELQEGRDAPACASSHVSSSAEETQQIAKDLLLYHISVLKQKCLIFALEGDLGTGKTQFAKGLAEALNINETITSPTFNLVREYPFSPLSRVSTTTPSLFHIDTWRLLDSKELDDLGLEQMLKPGNVIAIEWAEKLDLRFKNKDLRIIKIELEHKSETQRLIRISPVYHI